MPLSIDFTCLVAVMLVQDRDIAVEEKTDLKVVTERAPSEEEIEALLQKMRENQDSRENLSENQQDEIEKGIKFYYLQYL